MADTPTFKDAEAWLAARGIEPDPVAHPTDANTEADGGDQAPDALTDHPDAASTADVAPAAGDQPTATSAESAALGVELPEDVAEAVSFIRSSTAAAPQSEGRLRDKLAKRGSSDEAIAAALAQARRERLVDDTAMAAAFVTERRAKGHAPRRIRQDLASRGFDRDTIEVALGPAEAEDQEAAAFAVARERAARLTAVEPERAVRRLVGQLARRGYPEGLARKVSREAIYATREAQQAAEA